MSQQQSSYRQIMKATSLFGGVQVFQIIIQIIRSKFVAVLLGPAGMGISGLLISTTSIIAALTEFGLGSSTVRNIAEANGAGSETRISTTIIVLRRLVWITGLLGAIVTLVLSSWLSQLTFGNYNYTLAFVWLSITLLFMQLTNGQMVLLQGMRKLQYLAKANLYGSSLGLIITIPFYYLWGIDGIVPVLIITSVISLFFSTFFSKKINIPKTYVSSVRTIVEGKKMLSMGFMISLSGLITSASSYLIRIYISHHGAVDDVGLYNAGFAVIGTYVGMIFTAMGTDYYPRLAEVSNDNLLSRNIMNQQAEIALLILGPVLMVFLVFINWVIILLYSSKFLAINTMIYWAALGMFFKAASWSVGFIFLAKGESRIFFYSELVSNIYLLLLNLLGYYLWGLNGLGVSFFIGYFFVFCQVYIISKIKYEFCFNASFVKIFCILFSLAIFTFLSVFLLSKIYSYIVGIVLICFSAWYSYRELDKRLDFKSIIKK